MSTIVEHVPSTLIYEKVNGQPIYYQGYKDYLSGEKQLSELIGSSKFQSFLITELIFLIRSYLGKEYYVFSNEIGLQLAKKTWRAADIAILKKEAIQSIDNKYLEQSPNHFASCITSTILTFSLIICTFAPL